MHSYEFLFNSLSNPSKDLMKKNLSVASLVALTFCFYLITGFLPSCKKDSSVKLPQRNKLADVTAVLKPVTAVVNNQTGGYYVILPSDYDSISDKFPLLLSIAGAGQFGNGSNELPLLLKDGPTHIADAKNFPGTFTVNGSTTSLIVFTPQFKTFPSTGDLNDCIEYARKNYRIDASRIYVAGFSIGGVEVVNIGAESPLKIAAIVPMAGVPQDYATTTKCQVIAAANLPVWAFHSEDDPQINVNWTKGFISKIASYNPPVAPKLTLWSYGGHDAWTRAVDPSYKENGLNIYEWMLQYHR